MNVGFEQLHIDQETIHKLHEMGITDPTDIQAQVIPVVREGKDVIAQSQTGTGKTLAYLLPALQKIDPQLKHVQVMVLVPTRELGMQIVKEAEKLTMDTAIRSQPLIGGAALSRQVEKLKKLHPHLVVGTPGRILELVKTRKLNLYQIRTIIVDEVDQVFDLGSMNEVESILKSAGHKRQILFLSATIPPAIQQAADRWMQEPVTIRVNPEQRTAATLEHLYFVCEEREKIDTLRRLVRLYNPPSAIVFINATADVAEVIQKIQYVGLSIEALYGEAGKQDRAKVMNDFRERKFQLLLATDIAARGLDIRGVTHVINLDPPIDADHYVHRVGRTGRMGSKGTAVSIITPKEIFIMNKFSKALGIEIVPKTMFEGKVIDPEDRDAAASRRRPSARAPHSAAAAPTGAVPRTEAPRSAAHASVRTASTAAAGRSANVRTAAAAGTTRPKTSSAGGASRAKPSAGPGGKPAGAQGEARGAVKDKRKLVSERERKNKGAPKWLKEKQEKEK